MMKVAGFTFIKNSIKYDYPIVEAIQSILPICDSFYVLVGNAEDETLEQIKSIQSPKLKIMHSIWNESLTKEGAVLADETNKCMDKIPADYDWLFYIQADEVVHEKYLMGIQKEMKKHLSDFQVEGLLFNYLHFYGNYQYIGDSRKWYRNEIRIIRNNKKIRSFRDAQGFRKNGQKLKVMPIEAFIYHYGYIRNPKSLFDKNLKMARFYRTESQYQDFYQEFLKKYKNEFDFSEIDSIQLFQGTHPRVMQKRIEEKNWEIKLDLRKKNFKSIKDKILYYIEKYIGYRLFEYKNYHIIHSAKKTI